MSSLIRPTTINNLNTSEGRALEFQRMALIARGITPSFQYEPNPKYYDCAMDTLVDEIAKVIVAGMDGPTFKSIRDLRKEKFAHKNPWQIVASELRPDAQRLFDEGVAAEKLRRSRLNAVKEFELAVLDMTAEQITSTLTSLKAAA